jgi:hypothetical protein
VRQHYTQPIIFAVILTVLFGIRLVSTAVKSRREQNPS